MIPFIHISPRRADRGECMTQRGLQPGRPDAGFGQQRQHHHPVGRRPAVVDGARLSHGPPQPQPG